MNLTPVITKELKQMFHAPYSYVIAVILLLLTGFFFGNSYFSSGIAELRDFVSVMPFLLMFVLPALTMRLIAEERKLGTMEILATTPLTPLELVVGKYIAVCIFFSCIMLLTLYYPFVVFASGMPDTGQMLTTYAGLLLLGGMYLAAGLFASSLAENQVVAFIAGFVILFLFYLLDRVAVIVPDALGAFLIHFSAAKHFDSFSRGVLDLRDMLFFLSFIVLFLHFAVRRITRHGGVR